MFSNIMNKLSHLIQSKNQTSIQLLQKVIAPLAQIEAELPEKIFAFILSGEQAEVLMTLQHDRTDKAYALLGHPGHYGWSYAASYLNKKELEQLKPSEKARYQLYENIFSELDVQQIIRYSQFLVALSKQQNDHPFGHHTTLWFSMFLIDALFTSWINLQINNNSEKQLETNHKHHFRNWSLNAVKELYLTDDQHTEESFLTLLFTRQDLRQQAIDDVDILLTFDDSLKILAHNRTQIFNLIPTLDTTAQLHFLEFIIKKTRTLKTI